MEREHSVRRLRRDNRELGKVAVLVLYLDIEIIFAEERLSFVQD